MQLRPVLPKRLLSSADLFEVIPTSLIWWPLKKHECERRNRERLVVPLNGTLMQNIPNDGCPTAEIRLTGEDLLKIQMGGDTGDKLPLKKEDETKQKAHPAC